MESDEKNIAGGAGKATGREVMRPSPRLIEVARAYVDTLERDSRRLVETEEQLSRVIFQAATISNHNRTLQRLVVEVLKLAAAGQPLTQDHIDQMEEVLKVNQMMSDSVFICACGHSTFDHDDLGCQFIGCKPICGVV